MEYINLIWSFSPCLNALNLGSLIPQKGKFYKTYHNVLHLKFIVLKILLFSRKKMFPPINTNFHRFDNFVQIDSDDTILKSEYTSKDSIENLTNCKQTMEGTDDDFKDLFNGTAIKILAIVISLIRFTFTNIFYILVLLFEKYGGDPMKRSLKNQLVSQFGYGMMISNTICNPLLTWRIMFGPMPEGYIFIR